MISATGDWPFVAPRMNSSNVNTAGESLAVKLCASLALPVVAESEGGFAAGTPTPPGCQEQYLTLQCEYCNLSHHFPLFFIISS
jgi:hypothetical protein